MQQELSIEIERNPNDRYSEMMAKYLKLCHCPDVYLWYCLTTKQYFVSRYFKKENIINWYKTIKIIL